MILLLNVYCLYSLIYVVIPSLLSCLNTLIILLKHIYSGDTTISLKSNNISVMNFTENIDKCISIFRDYVRTTHISV